MSGRRSGVRALIAIDLTILAACVLTLVNVVATSMAANDAEILPKRAGARLFAMELFAAERLAVHSGQPVDVTFTRDPAGNCIAYRVNAPSHSPMGHHFAHDREFAIRLDVVCPIEKLRFLPTGRPEQPATIVLTGDGPTTQIVVSESGEVRITP